MTGHAGVVLLWSLAAIVAWVLLEAVPKALGWITQRVLQPTEQVYTLTLPTKRRPNY